MQTDRNDRQFIIEYNKIIQSKSVINLMKYFNPVNIELKHFAETMTIVTIINTLVISKFILYIYIFIYL